MSLFDDLLNKGGNKTTENTSNPATGQGAGQGSGTQSDDGQTITTDTNQVIASTDASDIIITPQVESASPIVPNVIATDTPAAQRQEDSSVQIITNHTEQNLTPSTEAAQIPTASPTIESTTLNHLAPIENSSPAPQTVLQSNTPTPISSVEEINTVSPNITTSTEALNAHSQISNITPVAPNPVAPTVEIKPEAPIANGVGGLFEMTNQDTETSTDFLSSDTLGVSHEEEAQVEQKMNLDDFILISLESIAKMTENLNNQKLNTENEAAEYKQQKEDFAQKEQDAYDAIIEIEKKKARVETMREYFEKQQKGEETKVGGSVETDLAEISTKEAVEKAVAPKTRTTRTRRKTTARKTTARKTTSTRKKAPAKKEIENAPLI